MSLLRPGVIKQHKPTNQPTLTLCCHYSVSKYCSASIVVTGTVRVNVRMRMYMKKCVSSTVKPPKVLVTTIDAVRHF